MVAELTSLTHLDLYGCSVTDKGLSAVAALTSLTQLDLAHCPLVRVEGVRAVAERTALTYLGLGSCELTDAGLQHLSNLKQLNLTDCSTTEEAEEELRQQIPGLVIEHWEEQDSDEEDWE